MKPSISIPIIVTLTFLLTPILAFAQTLTVSRIANLRSMPDVKSELLEKLNINDELLLLSTEKTNEYYHVSSLLSGQNGWVYSRLVRPTNKTILTGTILPAAGVVDIRVLDVGQGLATIIKLPGKKYVIYDAGSDANQRNGERTLAQIAAHIEKGSEIELLVLSHTDADHITAAATVILNYKVKKILWTGYERGMVKPGEGPTIHYKALTRALTQRPDTENVNLNERDSIISPGNNFKIGEATFTFLCGFNKPLPEWNLLEPSPMLNSVSIVMKLTYGGRSVLFCGDAVGKANGETETPPIATEKYLIENAAHLLASEVIIPAHHGASNGSSIPFVKLVNPKSAIFAAGRGHSHPTKRTGELFYNYTQGEVFRTDLGDDETKAPVKEWKYKSIKNHKDPYGDDDVHIQLFASGVYRVFYVN